MSSKDTSDWTKEPECQPDGWYEYKYSIGPCYSHSRTMNVMIFQGRISFDPTILHELGERRPPIEFGEKAYKSSEFKEIKSKW